MNVIIDQKATADHVTETLFQDVFKQSSHPKFNFLIGIKEKYDFKALENKFGEFINISELKKLNPEENQNYFHAEIDGAILIDLKPEKIQKEDSKGYAYIEIKLFTAPKENQIKILQRRLQKAPLAKYFKTRHLFGLIGFSYLRHKDSTDPVSKNDLRLIGKEKPNLWNIHLILFDEGFLNDFSDAPERANTIFDAIRKHNRRQPLSLEDRKEFIYSPTYNLVSVITLSQTVVRLEHRIDEVERRAVKLKHQRDEEKRRADKAEAELNELRKKMQNR